MGTALLLEKKETNLPEGERILERLSEVIRQVDNVARTLEAVLSYSIWPEPVYQRKESNDIQGYSALIPKIRTC